jgi:hypothetical protein
LLSLCNDTLCEETLCEDNLCEDTVPLLVDADFTGAWRARLVLSEFFSK